MRAQASRAIDTVVTGIAEARRRRTARLILELDLTETLVEGVPADPLAAILARRKTPLRVVVNGLYRAARDDRVAALVVKTGGSRSVLRLARAQELGEAIRDFRDQGKLAVAWAQTFGELSNGSVGYYLATFCEEVWLQPSGDVCLTGAGTEVPFLRGALDKVGITPQLSQRHEYKNAANILTERGFTESHRAATQRLVESMMDQLVGGIAANRRLDEQAVRSLIDRAPLFAGETRAAGLVDRLGYRDEVYDEVRRRAGDDAVQQYVGRYARPTLGSTASKRRASAEPTVALVPVTGPIHLGPSGRRGIGGGGAGSDTVVAALRAATKAADVKSIVLRVTSPGGSYVASDAIWRQVTLTREAGKPVVVSMGDVAASGGYYVSMGADVIVAEPGTLTGSIGAVAGKLVFDALVDRLGFAHDGVAEGRHARMFSNVREFSDDEWARLNAWLDRIYEDFTAKVAVGRGLGPEQLDEIARGRVWTGADAKRHGLVDELGGLRMAIELAKQRGGIPATAEVEPRLYPRVPMTARLRRAESSEDPAAAAARVTFEGWGRFAEMATRLGLTAFGPLTLAGGYEAI